MQGSPLRNLYQKLMDQNAQAFAARYFEVAYHALAAALYCARDLRDADRLAAVQRFAEATRSNTQ